MGANTSLATQKLLPNIPSAVDPTDPNQAYSAQEDEDPENKGKAAGYLSTKNAGTFSRKLLA